MDFYTDTKQNITTPLELAKLSYFPGSTRASFVAALNFSKAIKNEIIKVHNYAGVVVGYAVGN